MISPAAMRNIGISIYAPVKGATKVLSMLRTSRAISIHAPVKGATILCSMR